MIFTHDLKFYTEANKKLIKVTDELQMLNPSRRYLAIRTRIKAIDWMLNNLAKPFNNGGLSMGKIHFMNTVKPVLAIREILVVQYEASKPQEDFQVGGYTGEIIKPYRHAEQ